MTMHPQRHTIDAHLGLPIRSPPTSPARPSREQDFAFP